MQLMVATTLVLLCTRPLELAIFGQAPWLLTIPSVVIIGREVITAFFFCLYIVYIICNIRAFVAKILARVDTFDHQTNAS